MKKTILILLLTNTFIFYSQTIEFNNEKLFNVILKKYPDIDINNDLQIQKSEADKLKKIDLMEHNIDDISDLKYFENLEYLSLTINNIKNLKLNDFLYLKEIYCARNLLSVLEITNLPSLELLACGLNDLKNVKIEKCPKLEYLNLMDNKIEYIDLSSFSNLKYLTIDNNKLENLDLSKNKEIIQIDLKNNNLKELDLKNNDKLNLNICYMDDSVKLILNKKQSKQNKSNLPPPVIIQD